MLFEGSSSDKLYISKKDEMTFIYVISIDGNDNNKETHDVIKVRKMDLICDYDVSDDENDILNGDEIAKSKQKENILLNEIQIKEIDDKNNDSK